MTDKQKKAAAKAARKAKADEKKAAAGNGAKAPKAAKAKGPVPTLGPCHLPTGSGPCTGDLQLVESLDNQIPPRDQGVCTKCAARFTRGYTPDEQAASIRRRADQGQG